MVGSGALGGHVVLYDLNVQGTLNSSVLRFHYISVRDLASAWRGEGLQRPTDRASIGNTRRSIHSTGIRFTICAGDHVPFTI